MQPLSINYKGKNLTEFPESLRDNKLITNLNLDDNKLSSIPEWIAELTNLKVLYLNNNQITDWKILTALPDLEVLHLNENRIHLIPDSIVNLTKLKRLFINNNHLTSLPDTICQLSQLRVLLAANNKLTNIPSRIGDLKKLEVLNVFNNKITFIPESIGQLGSIDYLQLSSNEISELPKSIGKLQSVKTLDLFSNKLTILPSQLSQLTNLISLNISDNNITRIENIPDNVKRLSIYANPVVYIDPWIPKWFTRSSYDHQWEYLFVDRLQAQTLKLEKEKMGNLLKITDLVSRKIHFMDYNDMPPELIKKWELQQIKPPFERDL